MSALKDRILQMIVSGEFTGGQWLRESALAERLGVSRTPVRDALRELSALGVLDLVPHRGAKIREHSYADIEQIYRARAVVEPAVVASAVPHLSEPEIGQLKQLASHMRALQETEGGPSPEARAELSRLNNEFHQVFIDAAENRPLALSALHLRTPLLVARVFISYSTEALERSLMHHDELIIAAEAGDAGWAEAIMRAHILAGFQGHRAWGTSTTKR